MFTFIFSRVQNARFVLHLVLKTIRMDRFNIDYYRKHGSNPFSRPSLEIPFRRSASNKFLFESLLEKFDKTLDVAIDHLFTNYVFVCIINNADSLTKGHFFDRVSKEIRLLGAFQVSRTELLLVGLLIGLSIVLSIPRSASLLLLKLFLFPRKIRRKGKTFISFHLSRTRIFSKLTSKAML